MTTKRDTPETTTLPTAINPVNWWRTLCWIHPQIALCGDLDTSRTGSGEAQLEEWLAAGITDIVDARGEWNDERFVTSCAPQVNYHWVGTHDNGTRQADSWFDAGVTAAHQALADPGRKAVVHCHMGVNRGPSLAYAVLLTLGVDAVQALETIRAARPIAGIIYAEDAVSWWHRRIGSPDTVRQAERLRVRTWLEANDNDVAWIVSRIHRAG